MPEKEEEEKSINEQDKAALSIDEVVQLIGEFKRYQWFVGCLLCVALIPVATQVLMMYFAALNPNWKCTNNSSYCNFNGTLPPENVSHCSIPRTESEYTKEKHFSIVTEFELHCSRSWIIELSTSVLFFGCLCGSVVMGWIADVYGRKKIIFVSTGMVILLGSIAPFVKNVFGVIILRFLIGTVMTGSYQSSVLLSEIVASRYRPLASNLIWFFFPICLCILGVKAYFIRSWKMLMLACSAPYVFVLFFYFLVPESPRWLRNKGKKIELKKMLRKMAKVNRKDFPDNFIISCPVEGDKNTNPLHLFRSCRMTKMTLITAYAGFTNAITYYALSLLAGNLGGSLYTNFILFSLSEVPGALFSMYFPWRVGRKKSTIISMLSVGISCFASIFLPEDQHTLKVASGMVGKFFVISSWNCLGVWMVELYPTTLRSQSLSFGSTICTVGSTAVPWMIKGLLKYHSSGPYICLCVIAFSCSLLLCLLHDTTGLPTLESEGELMNGVVRNDIIDEQETDT